MSNPDRPEYAALLREGYRSIERLQKKLEMSERAKTEPVAIVGMGCRLPGGANDPESYWEMLRNGVDAITEVPRARWDISSYYDADPNAPGKMSTRWGGFIADVDRFDASLFGISPREAASMDPQQRILLEVAWEALENAGIAPDSLMGSRMGVFIGISTSDYSYIQTKAGGPETYDAYLATGNSHSMASGRLAYVFGLHGPTFSIDTACSSSLIAIHQACQALRAGHARAALAGGVNLILVPEATVTLSKAQMMAGDGRCKTFSAEADGFVRGEGCGVLVLKRLSDALADGDRVSAVIRGSAINQDGRSNGLTAPNGLAQAELIRQALADAGVTPSQVGYVEAHGTGTPLGDPIEVQALADALSTGRAPDNRLMIGSVKTNIGHLEAAAGVAGLMKAVLAIQHREIPAHLHLHNRNPHIAWDRIPIDVPTALRGWVTPARRIAGISAFGFSGSNAHVVIEEAPTPLPIVEARERPLHLLALSARTVPALSALATRYVRRLERSREVSLPDVCFTAGAGRSHLPVRLALTAGTVEEAREKLAAYVDDPATAPVLRGENHRSDHPEVAFLFTGQGSQYAQMGRQLFETQPTFRRTLQRCADLLRGELERPLIDVLYPTAGEDGSIDETAYAQPALFAVEYALAELWRSWGIEPGVVVGHGLGEYVAACVAGAITLEAALTLVAARARLMQALPRDGAMVALSAEAGRVETVIRSMGEAARVSIAAIDAPNATIISGAADAVARVRAWFEAAGSRTRALAVSHAFHSHTVEPMLSSFEAIAGTVAYEAPRIAWVSTVNAELIRGVDAAYWRRQARAPVRFAEAVSTLRQRGVGLAVEMGPSPVLLGWARQCDIDAPGWVGSLRKGGDDWSEALTALGTLYVHGAAVNWAGVDRDYTRRRIVLPTYPFERESYWRAPRGAGSQLASQNVPEDSPRVVHPLLGVRLRSPLPEIQFENRLGRKQPSYLADHVVFGMTIVPSSIFAQMALAAASVAMPGRASFLTDVAQHEPLVLPDEGTCTVQVVLGRAAEDRTAFRILSLPIGSDEWTLHATGTIRQDGVLSVDGAPSFGAVRRACCDEISIASYYDRLRGQGLEYGESFRGLRELWRGERQAIGRVELASELHAEAGSFDIHPVLLDSCIQVLGAALPLDSSRDQAGQTYLPMGFGELTTCADGATVLWSHASIRETPAPGAETLVADITLFDASGRQVGRLTGLLLKRARVEALRRVVRPAALADWFYQERWEPMPMAAHARAAGMARRHRGAWLVLAFEKGPGAAAVNGLRARGEAVLVVRPGEAYVPVVDRASDFFTIDPAVPDQYVQLLADVARYGACAGVVHTWAATAESAIKVLDPNLLACRGALYLAQAAVACGNAQNLWFVTCGAQAVSGIPQILDVSQSPLAGFARSLALEQPALGSALVDLDPKANPCVNAAHLVDELLAGSEQDEIAFRDGARFARRLERALTSPQRDAAMPSIRSDATYLISGGLGGLGLIIARWLADRGARHLALVGRSGASAASAGAVQDLERQGVRIRIARANVGDEAQMRALMNDIAGTMPPLRGVVHAAGVVEDGLIGRLTWDAFERVLCPKAQGARILHLLTEKIPLDFMVLCSSSASFFGSPGQSNYAAANAYLDALSMQRRALGQPALSVNWGPWPGVGMAAGLAAGHQLRWSRDGVGGITAETGMKALERAFGQPGGQIAIVPIDWREVCASDSAFARRPFVRHLLPQASAEIVSAGPVALSRDMVLALPEEDRAVLVTERLREIVAWVLGLPPASLDIDEEVARFGFDSLMAMELKNRLEAGLGVVLPMGSLLEAWSVKTLASMVVEAVGMGAVTAAHNMAASAVTMQEGEI